jgi:hypothetical protein
MKKIIGRKDKADFPELFLTNINCKVDTGAYTSSIHCHHIQEVEVNGIKYIEFQLLDPTHTKFHDEKFKTKRYKKKRVKNSFGQSEWRFVVETSIVLFGNEYPIELSLSERSEMKYPILIGRKLLRGRFIVDISQYNLSYKMKQKELKNNLQSKIKKKKI